MPGGSHSLRCVYSESQIESKHVGDETEGPVSEH